MKKKRFLSGLLALVMVLAMLPGEAWAYKTHPADVGTNQRVSLGLFSTAAIGGDGKLYLCGDLFISDNTPTTPQCFVPSETFKSVAVGREGGVAITTGGSLYAWGKGDLIGTGSTDSDWQEPTLITLPNNERVACATLTCNLSTTYAAITESGTLYTWGSNTISLVGEPCTSMTLSFNTPHRLMEDKTFRSVCFGDRHAAALTTDGQLYTWGSNQNGQLGTGSTDNAENPVLVSVPGTSFSSVVLFGNRSAAISTAGELYMWGENIGGAAGTGTESGDILVPTKVLDNVKSVAMSIYNSLALKTDGTVWAWGGHNALLGDGRAKSSSVTTPKQLNIKSGSFQTPLQDIVDIAMSSSAAAAVSANGTLYGWGSISGNGTDSGVTRPEVIMEGTTFTSVFGGHANMAALGARGELYTWGSNSFGELGTGTTEKQLTPYMALYKEVDFSECQHQWSEYRVLHEPTCTEPGSRGRNCMLCGAAQVEAYAAPLGHQWSEFEVIVPAANCRETGIRTRTCSRCGETEEEHFQGPHSEVSGSSCAEPTICAVCLTILRSAGQHDLTYTANGAVITETCTFDCGHIATATITAGDAYYTGKEIKTADVVKDPEWEGGELEIAYTKNVNIGTATASITAGGATASVNFKVMSKINLKNYKGTVSTFYTMEKSWSFNDKLKDQNKDDIVYSLTQASLANADEDTAKAIRAQLYNLLFVSSFSPTTFGNSTEEIKKWHPQNIDNSATKLTGRAEDTGLKSIGVAPIQWDFGAKGCYSYALYAEKYVYGTNGKKVSIGQTPSAEQIVESFHQYLDPGEAIRYEKPIYIGGKSYTTGHALLFLGESIDEKGFYFVSYGGGASDEGTSHTMSAGYFSYTDFANVLRTNNYRLFLFDANNGSYLTKASKVGLNPETKSGQIKMNCPVEAVVSLNNETLDSRRLNSGETASTSFGTMSVSGPVGGDREILVCFNEGYIDTDGLEFTVIGTDRGTMDITITYIYTEPEIDSAEKTDTRIFENIPITADTVITTSRLAEKNTTELYVTSAGTDSAEIWDANNGETVVAPTSYTAQDDPVVEPNASGNPDIPIYPVSPAPSTPASIRKENTDVPEATAEPETPDAAETPQTPAAMSFTDVPASAWYYNAVQYVYEKGIMNGTAAALFSPDASTTRGMIVTILYRLEGEPAAGGSAFTDVPAGQWYTSAVGWAAANGIVDGYGDGRFGPGDTVTREQLAAILYRYTAFKGGDTSARVDVGAYRDGAEISPYALEAICWAAAEGVINGFDDGRLAPRESASRAQVAQMLMNYLPQ